MTEHPSNRGGRPRTGTFDTLLDGRHQPIITLPDGSRKRMKPLPLGTSEATPREKAEFWTEEAARLGTKKKQPAVAAPTPGAEWWKDYLDYRAERGLSGVGGLYRSHLAPVVSKHPRDVTAGDCRAVRDALDAKVREDKISWKTAFNARTVWTTECKAAPGLWKKDKPLRFKVRDDDPSQGVAPPDIDDPKESQWLYPDEFLKLVSCERVPLEWRRRYALAVYLFVRGGELKALRFGEDVDVDRGVVSVRLALDSAPGVTKQTKTGNKGIRRFALDANVLPLIRAMSEEAGAVGEVVDLPLTKWWALKLREHLATAGVTRAALYQTDVTRKRLRFHDLRSTGLTWMAIRGDDPLKIMLRAGHTNLTTTQRYICAAEAVGTAIGDVFPPLPPGLLGEGNRSQFRSAGTQVPGITVEASGIEPESARHPA